MILPLIVAWVCRRLGMSRRATAITVGLYLGIPWLVVAGSGVFAAGWAFVAR